MKIRDRIKELRRVPAKSLLHNAKNFRRHPKHQAEAMRGILEEVGYAGALLARETEQGLEILDGHLRADTTPDQEVPVLVLDVTAEEGDKILATFDPIGAMASADAEELKSLLQSLETENKDVKRLLEKIAEEASIFNIEEVSNPALNDGDRNPFRQVTFTLHDSQHEEVEAALTKAKELGASESRENENSNGNALAFICSEFNRRSNG